MELLNKHKHGTPRGSIYIGRGSPLGNPFVIGKDGTRDEVIQKYDGWLKERICLGDQVIIKALRDLNVKSRLLCFCYPQNCHGSIVEKYWLEIMKNEDFNSGLREFRKKHTHDAVQEYKTWLLEKLICRDPSVTMDFREQILSYDLIPEKYRGLPLGSSVLIPLHREMVAFNDYDGWVASLAKAEGMLHIPSLDGKTHINVYSKGATELGRALSNFAAIGFEHPTEGKCASVEGFWYYLKSGRQYPYLRDLHGNNAKTEGKRYPIVHLDDFLDRIKEAITCKITQNPELLKAFKESTLPFTHYYWYGSIFAPRVLSKETDTWLTDHLEDLRKSLCSE